MAVSERDFDRRHAGGTGGAGSRAGKGLSANVVSRLKAEWAAEYAGWMKRDLSAQRYVYGWADGIRTRLRQEDDAKACLLVIARRAQGVADDWRRAVRLEGVVARCAAGLAGQGLASGPLLAVGDGALGFWAALDEVFPETRRQRCWVHKTANVLNDLPKSLQAKAKADLHEIWMARPVRRQCRLRPISEDLPRQVSEGGGQAGQGPDGAARLLRLSGRALDTPADDQPDRVDVRHRPPSHHADEELRLPQHLPGLGVPTGADGQEAGEVHGVCISRRRAHRGIHLPDVLKVTDQTSSEVEEEQRLAA